MISRENGDSSFDNDQKSIPHRRSLLIAEDKLHRRNPLTVRQEIQTFDDLAYETTLADVHLNEMPGLQNTEQWKRIAARNVQISPPLSRQYYLKATSISESQDDQIPEVLGSYHRSEHTGNEQDTITTMTPSLLQNSRRKILLGLSIITIMIAIIVAVVVAVILVRKPVDTTTDYYSGYIVVQAYFNPILLSPSSTLSRNYQREFCSLISTTLSDTKTKYAIFFSSCTANNFRNGSIISDFILGFTRYQNVTRLNRFLTRTLVNRQLYGGSILSIIFNLTNIDDNNDYDGDYD